MADSAPFLSVKLSTFNQAPYIRQAIESILMQKVNFSWEFCIVDDCSSDGTQDILREYAERYPDLIRLHINEQNLGAARSLLIINKMARGQYCATLEGDDYWLEEDRLQTCVDFLVANPRYSRVCHSQKTVDDDDNFIGYNGGTVSEDRDFSIQDWLKGDKCAQSPSVYRNYYLETGDKYDKMQLVNKHLVDFQDMFITQDFGLVRIFARVLSAHRTNRKAGNSNYNSITRPVNIFLDFLRSIKAVKDFYGDKYDLSYHSLMWQRPLWQRLILFREEPAVQDVVRKGEYLELCTEPVKTQVLAELFAEMWRKRKFKSFLYAHRFLGLATLRRVYAARWWRLKA